MEKQLAVNSTPPDTPNTPPPNLNGTLASLSISFASKFSLFWESFYGPKFVWSRWLFPLLAPAALLLMLDYLYRLVHTFRLIRQHWNRYLLYHSYYIDNSAIPTLLNYDFKNILYKQNATVHSLHSVYCTVVV